MGLEEQALTIQQKIAELEAKCLSIADICTLVLTEHKMDGDTFTFSQADKQKLITYYQTRKAELVTLVSELP